MKVVFEPEVKEHDAALYESDRIAPVVEGWEAVNDAVTDRYMQEGYIIVSKAFTGDEIEEAKEELSNMTLSDNPECDSIYYEGSLRNSLTADTVNSGVDRKKDSGVEKLAMGTIGDQLPKLKPELRARYVRKFMGFTSCHPSLDRLASNPSLISLIKKLCKVEDVELFQEMAMIKPPGGREKPWHQDHAYFNYPIETRIVGVWIALGDVNKNNGCMFLMPGEHKNGPLLHFMKRDWQICDDEIYNVLAGKRTAALMKAGDVLIFDSKLPHGTPKNNTSDYRWALQFHYKATTSQSCSDDQRLELFGSEGKNVTC